jgi:hypothetical protein
MLAQLRRLRASDSAEVWTRDVAVQEAEHSTLEAACNAVEAQTGCAATDEKVSVRNLSFYYQNGS